MKIWIGPIAGLWLALVGCSRPSEPIPSDIISPDQMIPILVDVHLIEGARNGSLILGDTNDIEDYYLKVYTKHSISEKHFKESFAFYSKHPDHFIPIYQKVLDSLKVNGALIARKGVEIDHEE